MAGYADDILLLATGGTIDSEWDPTKDTVVPSSTTHIEKLIRDVVKINHPLRIQTVGMLDSRDINDEFRGWLLSVIKKAPQSRILITHGTYTMPETAVYLAESIGKSKTIVLTGSFYPPYHISTDVGFNLGYALSALQHLSEGVYVAMHGSVFEAGKCRKDVEAGRFVSC